MTQEFMAEVLGVRRASVSEVASVLQKAGLIHYSRGQITILNRPGLEATVCECYDTLRAGFERVMAGNSIPEP